MINLFDYYKRRAEEYEEIYQRDDPVRQEEQRRIIDSLTQTLKNRNVIEIACGTGYWTKFLSETAKSIVATDVSQEILGIAEKKSYNCPVSLYIEDAYNLSFEDRTFDGGLANFWLSHVPRDKFDFFLNEFHRVLQSGSKIFMADNVYIPGIGGKLVVKREDKNTYKLRKLKDGNEYLILKNYFTLNELIEIFSRHVKEFNKENIFYGSCFWFINYELE